MNEAFWKNKKVLITGHTGFKGSWLSLCLQRLGANLLGVALPPDTSPSLFQTANIDKDMLSVLCDIRDLDRLVSIVKEFRPEIVLHLAAQALVRTSYTDPIETYSTNIMGTANLLEAIRNTDSVKAVVIVTSDKCYENKEWDRGYQESDNLGGFDPYSSSKACAELVTAAYRNSFFNLNSHNKHGVAIATARAGNVIGGGDWSDDRLVPDIIKSFSNSQSARIRNPGAIRPWQHVLEPLYGYLLLAKKLYENGPTYAEAWNFGPNNTDNKTVLWIATHLEKLWKLESSLIVDENKKQDLHEAHYLKLDSTKAHDKLKWQPKWDIMTALEKTHDWYQSFLHTEDMHDFTLKQIEQYDKTL